MPTRLGALFFLVLALAVGIRAQGTPGAAMPGSTLMATPGSDSTTSSPGLPDITSRDPSGARGSAAPQAEASPIVQAMQDELTRSVRELRLKDQPAPYYVAYTIEDVVTASRRATLGAPLTSSDRPMRLLRVDVRVGDYEFDSSGFLSYEDEAGVMPGYYTATGISCPLDDDYDALRRQIWLMTDAAYKRAISVFSKKRATFENRAADLDPLSDFSRETPSQTLAARVVPSPVPAAWDAALQRISRVFVDHPDIVSSQAAVEVTQGTRYFLNSEGFKSVTPIQSAVLLVHAETRAPDGMRLRDFATAVERRLEDLPSEDEMIERARTLATDLAALRTAMAADDYNGPVLVEGQATGELLAQTFVPLLLSQRAPESDTPRGELLMQSSSPYLRRIGSRVLPESFVVTDAPSRDRVGDRPVPGAYVVDDEGVRAQDVELIREGRLLTLLTGRTPQKRLPNSNGHGRGGSAQAGVIEMASTEPVSAAALKRQYLELLARQERPYGYIVRGVIGSWASRMAETDADDFLALAELMQGHGAGASGPAVARVFRVTPDGREELVRGLTFGQVPHSAYKDIIAASDSRRLYSYPATSSGGSYGFYSSGRDVTVSLIAPDLLFDELDLERSHEVPQKAPVVPSPLAIARSQSR